MLKKYHFTVIILATFLIILFQNNKTIAQQTIFDVPSADITQKGMIFFQHESQFSNKFGIFTNYGAYGISKNTEINITLYGVGTKKFRNEVLGIGFKTALPIHEKSETKFTFGHQIPISLRGSGVGGYTFSHLSTRLPRTKTRITSGIAIGTTTLFGRDFISFIGGIEQPITKKINLLMDWYSGKHSYGLLIPGFSYSFNPNLTLYTGFQIPNNKSNGDKGFVIELAKIF